MLFYAASTIRLAIYVSCLALWSYLFVIVSSISKLQYKVRIYINLGVKMIFLIQGISFLAWHRIQIKSLSIWNKTWYFTIYLGWKIILITLMVNCTTAGSDGGSMLWLNASVFAYSVTPMMYPSNNPKTELVLPHCNQDRSKANTHHLWIKK